MAQRSNDIVEAFAWLHRQQFMRRNTDTLHDEGDCSFFDIRPSDGQWDAFGKGVHTDDHEVTGTATSRNERSFDYKLRYIVREKTFRDNFIHLNIVFEIPRYRYFDISRLEMFRFFADDRGEEVVRQTGSAETEPLVVEPFLAENLFDERKMLYSLVGR